MGYSARLLMRLSITGSDSEVINVYDKLNLSIGNFYLVI